MKLISKPATETDPQKILLFSDNGSPIGSINKSGSLQMISEDAKLFPGELREAGVIAANFDLFFKNIAQESITAPTLERYML